MLIQLASRQVSDESEIRFEQERFEDTDNVFSSPLYKAFTEKQRARLISSLQESTAASDEIYKKAEKLLEVASNEAQKEISRRRRLGGGVVQALLGYGAAARGALRVVGQLAHV